MSEPQTSGAPRPHTVLATRGGVKLVPSKKRGHHMHILEDSDDVLREQATGFVNFLREYAVVGLAIGFIVGQQANVVVKQLVVSFIEPWLQVLFGKDLGERVAHVHHGTERIDVAWGQFVYVFIEFLFVAITIYVVVKLFRLDKLKKPKEDKK